MNIGIVGVGLIGGSLGREIKSRTNHKVYAFDIDKEVMIKAKLLDAFDYELNDSNIGDIDILFFALYPSVFVSEVKEYTKKLKNGAVVCDLCGTKKKAVACMNKLSGEYPTINFMGGHPMAGREFSGIAHSTSSLYEGASMILIPLKDDINLNGKMKEFFLEVGFKQVVFTTAEEHDRIISYTSQLAHIVSSAYIKSPTAKKERGFSAGSFKDMTRVARLSPQMWSELMMDNAENLSYEIEEFIIHLTEYKKALDNKDSKKLFVLLDEGNSFKLDDLKKSDQ